MAPCIDVAFSGSARRSDTGYGGTALCAAAMASGNPARFLAVALNTVANESEASESTSGAAPRSAGATVGDSAAGLALRFRVLIASPSARSPGKKKMFKKKPDV